MLQRMPRFSLDAASLRRLDAARVPVSVIDLVVALASPERFAHRLATRGYTFIRIDPPRISTAALAPPPAANTEVTTPHPGSASVTIEGREYYGHLHRHYRGCGHYDLLYIGGIPLAPYAFYPYWMHAYGYGAYGGYGYYPYDIHDPYRVAPATPTGRGPTRVIDLPDRRPAQPAPQPDPDPARQPAGGRVVNGRGYTKPAEPAASRGGTSTPVPTRGSAAKPAAETKPESKPAPASEPRTAKRRPPGAA